MRNKVLAALAALIVMVGAWYWFSPSFALKGLRDAAIAGDKQELADRVDFPAVRESVKHQFKIQMAAKLSEEKDNPFAGLALMMVDKMVDSLLDTAISPEGIKGLVEHGKFQKQGAPSTGPEASWEIERMGMSRFRVTAAGKPGDKSPTLLFVRDGLGWRMVDIELPKDMMKDAPGDGAKAPSGLEAD